LPKNDYKLPKFNIIAKITTNIANFINLFCLIQDRFKHLDVYDLFLKASPSISIRTSGEQSSNHQRHFEVTLSAMTLAISFEWVGGEGG